MWTCYVFISHCQIPQFIHVLFLRKKPKNKQFQYLTEATKENWKALFSRTFCGCVCASHFVFNLHLEHWMCSLFAVAFNGSIHLFCSFISFCLFHDCPWTGWHCWFQDQLFALLSFILICSTDSKNRRQCVYILFASCGPKPCEACRQEEMYEEPISILNSSEVSQRVQCKA